MQIILDVPEDVAQVFDRGTLDRIAVEAIAAEGYRTGLLSECQLQRMLGLSSRFAVHDWLREHGIHFNYTKQDLVDDLSTLSELGFR